MNKTVKYLSVLSGAVVLAQIFGKFFYFSLFRIFTFEIGYLSLIGTGLVLFFLLLAWRQKALTLVLTLTWLFVWLLLPPSLKKPFIEEYISLPAGYEIETVLTKAPIFKSLIRTWD